MTYRPFLTYEEQIYKLSHDYGLVINDKEFAIEALSSLSYYDLINGYKEVYMDGDKFIDNVSLEFLTMIHIFNKNVQSILLKYATYTETAFKTALAYELSAHIGIQKNEYLDMKKYRRLRKKKDRDNFKKTIKSINKTFGNEYYPANDPTKHYLETKDHVPPWILLKNVSFSDSTDWYSFLPENLKENVFNNMMPYSDLTFNKKNEVFTNSLILIRKFRNVIAHNLKFITYKISNSKIIPKEINSLFHSSLVPPNEVNFSRNDAWGMILSIIALNNNKGLKKNFIMELIHTLTQPIGFTGKEARFILDDYCILTHIPKDIVTRLNNYLNHLNS